MEIPDIRFWAGTDESFAVYITALKAAVGLDFKAYHGDDEDDDRPPRLLTKQGDVGIISINGPLVPSAPWYARYVGITGYDEIREALVAAAQDRTIGAILLDINSGGGAVSGVTDISELISKVDKEVKPVQTFSDGIIASAAYWTGSSGRRIDIGKVTEAGSIGVLTVHREVTKAMAMAGITATVMRAGEFKALGHAMEPLSDKAKVEMQAQLDQVYRMFVEHVADARGVSYEVADERMAQGRLFIGERAVATGLVDGVSNFDAVISKIQGAIDSEKTRSQYGANFPKGPAVRTALTQQQLAAMAEGGVVPGTADAQVTTPVVIVPEPDKKPDPEADAAPAQADKPANADVVAYLQGQLTSAQSQATELTIQVRDLKAASDATAGVMASFRNLVQASLDRLKVAMGGSPGVAEGMTDSQLLAEHATLRAQFETKFKAGGVAAVTSSGSSEKSVEQEDPNRLRRIQATRQRK